MSCNDLLPSNFLPQGSRKWSRAGQHVQASWTTKLRSQHTDGQKIGSFSLLPPPSSHASCVLLSATSRSPALLHPNQLFRRRIFPWSAYPHAAEASNLRDICGLTGLACKTPFLQVPFNPTVSFPYFYFPSNAFSVVVLTWLDTGWFLFASTIYIHFW